MVKYLTLVAVSFTGSMTRLKGSGILAPSALGRKEKAFEELVDWVESVRLVAESNEDGSEEEDS